MADKFVLYEGQGVNLRLTDEDLKAIYKEIEKNGDKATKTDPPFNFDAGDFEDYGVEVHTGFSVVRGAAEVEEVFTRDSTIDNYNVTPKTEDTVIYAETAYNIPGCQRVRKEIYFNKNGEWYCITETEVTRTD